MPQIDETDEDEASSQHTGLGRMSAVALLVKIITSVFPLIHRLRWERLLYPSCGSGSSGEYEARRLRATIVFCLDP